MNESNNERNELKGHMNMVLSNSPSTEAAATTTTTTTMTKAAPLATAATADKKKDHPILQFIAGGVAGLTESSICHPLDTIKTRMQLRRQRSNTQVEQVVVQIRHSLIEPAAMRLRHSLQEPGLANRTLTRQVWSSVAGPMASSLKSPPTFTTATSTMVPRDGVTTLAANNHNSIKMTGAIRLGPLGTARRIVETEGFWALYKGLSAVYTGAVLKFSIRFVSFEQYRTYLQTLRMQQQQSQSQDSSSIASILRVGTWSPTTINMLAGLSSGLTEAVLVVTPVEVCKIRMQAQRHSLLDASARPKYRNVLQTAQTIIREEGPSALYKGVIPTMLRQGINQAANFTAYHAAKQYVLENHHTSTDKNGQPQLEHWQSLLIGGLSGGVGPLCNNPLDVVKTRLQKQVVMPGHTPKYTGLIQGCMVIAKDEGAFSLWKGITPRLMRIVPGQAITFMTYEAVSNQFRGYF